MFDNSSITVLRGPDRVRKRPAVLFGSEGVEGTICAVTWIADILVGEAICHHSDGLYVTIHKDESVTLQSYDRGFLLSDCTVDEKPKWSVDFCELYAGGSKSGIGDDGNYRYELGNRHICYYDEIPFEPPYIEYNGMELCAVQFASRFMQTESVREGIKGSIRFEKGFPVSDLVKEPSNERSYTRFHFLPDADVFRDIRLPREAIDRYLQITAATVPNLCCVFTDERDGYSATYRYPKGVADYAAQTSNLVTPLFVKTIEAVGKDRYDTPEYTAQARLVFAFVAQGGRAECLHNYRTLPYGGTHLTALKEAIQTFLQWDFKDVADNVSLDDRLLILLETKSTCTRYESGTRQSINNRMLTDMASDLANGDFRHYLAQHRDAITALFK